MSRDTDKVPSYEAVFDKYQQMKAELASVRKYKARHVYMAAMLNILPDKIKEESARQFTPEEFSAAVEHEILRIKSEPKVKVPRSDRPKRRCASTLIKPSVVLSVEDHAPLSFGG